MNTEGFLDSIFDNWRIGDPVRGCLATIMGLWTVSDARGARFGDAYYKNLSKYAFLTTRATHQGEELFAIASGVIEYMISSDERYVRAHRTANTIRVQNALFSLPSFYDQNYGRPLSLEARRRRIRAVEYQNEEDADHLVSKATEPGWLRRWRRLTDEVCVLLDLCQLLETEPITRWSSLSFLVYWIETEFEDIRQAWVPYDWEITSDVLSEHDRLFVLREMNALSSSVHLVINRLRVLLIDEPSNQLEERMKFVYKDVVPYFEQALPSLEQELRSLEDTLRRIFDPRRIVV